MNEDQMRVRSGMEYAGQTRVHNVNRSAEGAPGTQQGYAGEAFRNNAFAQSPLLSQRLYADADAKTERVQYVPNSTADDALYGLMLSEYPNVNTKHVTPKDKAVDAIARLASRELAARRNEIQDCHSELRRQRAADDALHSHMRQMAEQADYADKIITELSGRNMELTADMKVMGQILFGEQEHDMPDVVFKLAELVTTMPQPDVQGFYGMYARAQQFLEECTPRENEEKGQPENGQENTASGNSTGSSAGTDSSSGSVLRHSGQPEQAD